MKINGRENDIALLEQLYESKRPEFVVVYGRRRVGKTYLVSELFKSRFTFYHTGLSPLQQDKKNFLYEQLHAFYTTLRSYGLDTDIPRPQNWLDAFELLGWTHLALTLSLLLNTSGTVGEQGKKISC